MFFSLLNIKLFWVIFVEAQLYRPCSLARIWARNKNKQFVVFEKGKFKSAEISINYYWLSFEQSNF